MARTKFQQLQAAKKSHCAGRTTMATVNKKKKAYIDDAVKKGNKTKAEATASANRVIKKSCGIGSTKKRKTKTTKKKTTARRRR